MPQPTPRYTSVAIALHWIIAAVIIAQVFGGLAMGNFPDGPLKFAAYQWHKTLGLLVLFLSLSRLAWRVLNPPPAEPPMPAWQSAVSQITHTVFYALMIAIPLTGWALVSLSPREVPTLVFNAVPWPHLAGLADLSTAAKSQWVEVAHGAHTALAFATMGLLALHVGAALKHQFIDKDNLLARMVPGVFGPTQASPPHKRSIAIAAGVFILPILLGLAMVPLSRGHAPSLAPSLGAQDQAATPPTNAAAPWLVDHSQSQLQFQVVYNGAPLTGDIPDWTAAINFDADNLATAAARVTVSTPTIATGDGYFDGLLRTSDGLQTDRHPQITVNLSNFVQLGDGSYRADAAMEIVDQTLTAPFTFSLSIENDIATMAGTLDFNRLDLDLGRINDPSGMYLGEQVTVTTTLRAQQP